MPKKEALKEMIIQDIIAYIVEDRRMSIVDAMTVLFNSKVYALLQDDENELYLDGSAYVYDLLKNELQNGYIIQQEI